MSLLSSHDLYLFNEGSHFELYKKLGAHLSPQGAQCAVWAPNAREVWVVGDFNNWRDGENPLSPQERSGIWTGLVSNAKQGQNYKYRIRGQDGKVHEKCDPFGFFHEIPPKTASRFWDLSYEWRDQSWMDSRRQRQHRDQAISIYEIHLASWRSNASDHHEPLTYRELAQCLPEYVAHLGFTHVELMPVMEHPFGGSWGYQLTGYFAPTSRHGTPQDLMFLIDRLHEYGIGVILDWVPAHFATDAHGLGLFDGTHLYEHADSRKGFHPDWTTYIFNYGRHEVRSFLISSAAFWLDVYHADALRVDGVASMLYLDYSRNEGQWIPNDFGGRENLEAISFLKRLNEHIYQAFPDVHMIAEESTAWPGVSKPTYHNGLGFGFKWDMGWMHDTLQYLSRDPAHRKYHHHELTFRMLYAWNESFMLPLSHDEVVHGKGSLLEKMPGDEWQKFANLRLLYAYMWANSGKKLLFMGGEFAQTREWNHEHSLDWHVEYIPTHHGVQKLICRLNEVYRNEPALHQRDLQSEGFEWIEGNDQDQSCLAFLRHCPHQKPVLAVFNFTPVPRFHYRLGVPHHGFWRELVNTDALEYAGSGLGNQGEVHAMDEPSHGQPFSLSLTLPPLAALFLRPA